MKSFTNNYLNKYKIEVNSVLTSWLKSASYTKRVLLWFMLKWLVIAAFCLGLGDAERKVKGDRTGEDIVM